MFDPNAQPVVPQPQVGAPIESPGGAVVVRKLKPHGPLAAPQAATGTGFNVFALLRALQRRWLLAVSLGVLFAGSVAGAVWHFSPPRFTARTMIHVAANRPHVLMQMDRVNDFASYQRTQIALVKSRLVLNRALNNPNVAALSVVKEHVDPILWLEKEIQADFLTAPEVLKISMNGEKGEELKVVVDAVRESYVKEIVNKEFNQQEMRLTKLRELFAEADKQLQEKRRVLKSMSEDLGSSKDPKVMEKTQLMAFRQLDGIQAQLLTVQAKLRQAQMEAVAAPAQKKDGKDGKGGEAAQKDWAALLFPAPKEEVDDFLPLPEHKIQEWIDKNPKIQDLEKEIARLDRIAKQIHKNAHNAEKEPVYKAALAAQVVAKKHLADTRAQLRQELAQKVRGDAHPEIKGSNQSYTQKQIAVLEMQDKWLTQEVNNYLKKFQGLSKRRVDVEWLRDEITLADEITRKMASQLQILQVEQKAPERITVMEEAIVLPDQDSPLKKAGIAGGAIFFLVLLGVAFLEYRTHKINGADDVVNGLKLRLVGAIPARVKRGWGGLNSRKSQARWQQRLTESIDATRTMLLHTASVEPLRIVMVTSAVGGEGKTTLSAHLAVSLARSGRRTLLIDGDLRRPSLQKLFNLPLTPGLSEILRGETALAAVVRPGPVEGLSILTAGRSDPLAIQALSRKPLEDLFQLVREQYDFVIVDSAPVLPVADSQLLAQHTDAVIFSVLREVSRLPLVYAAYERLKMLRTRILGAVVNGTQDSIHGGHYSYESNTPPASAAS